MTVHTFRNPDILPLQHYREAIRQSGLPSGREGLVVEDVDLAVRWFGPKFGRDDTGAFMLVEIKRFPYVMETAQLRTFGLLNYLLRQGDPDGRRYKGFYLLQDTDDNWDVSRFYINERQVTTKQFWLFMQGRYLPVPYFEEARQ